MGYPASCSLQPFPLSPSPGSSPPLCPATLLHVGCSAFLSTPHPSLYFTSGLMVYLFSSDPLPLHWKISSLNRARSITPSAKLFAQPLAELSQPPPCRATSGSHTPSLKPRPGLVYVPISLWAPKSEGWAGPDSQDRGKRWAAQGLEQG